MMHVHVSVMIILAGAILDSTETKIVKAVRNSTEQTGRPNYVVELAIFCDKAFSDHFDNDEQVLKNHLVAELWDLSMRFRTLRSTQISFRVTSVNIFKNSAKQPFIHNSKNSVTDTTLETVDTNFRKWLYQNMKHYPQFDIALLLTGQVGFEEYRCVKGAVCQINSKDEIYISTITLRYNKPNWHGCGDFARPFGKLFGASCKDKDYLMCDNCAKENKKHYFFSKDSDANIHKTVTLYDAHCLLETDFNAPLIFDSGYDEIQPASIEKQCQFQLGTSFPLTVKHNEECFKTTCYKNNVSYGDIYPIENSPCRDGMECFRGQCRKRGHLLRNVGSGYYLQSSDLSTIYDNAVLVECLQMASPLERIIRTQYYNGSYLQMATSIPNSVDGVTYKCLTFSLKHQRLCFMNCMANNTFHRNNAWQFKYVGNDEFILYHELTKLCAKVTDDMEIIGHADCSKMDLRVRWKFDNELADNENTKCSRQTTTQHTTEPWQVNCYSGLYFLFGIVCSLVVTMIFLGMKLFLRLRTPYTNIPVKFTRDENLV